MIIKGVGIEIQIFLTQRDFKKIWMCAFWVQPFFGCNFLLAKTYCYNFSVRQEYNLRPNAPKAPHTPLASLGF